MRIDRPLDIERLQACWRRALLGDDAFRLRFEFENGEFRQWMSEEIAPVEIVDLTGAPDPETEAREWLWREAGAPARPDEPARAVAVVDRPDRFFLMLSLHHALTDGYGMNPLVATIDAGYKMTDVPLDLLARPEPTDEHTDRSAATYRDIVEDDAMYRASARYAADRAGLLAALHGVEPALFPARHGTPRMVRGHYRTMIPGAYLDRVRATGVSVFAYLMAAVATYLTTIHRREQVVIGVPMLNRHSAQTYRTQGHRANVVPLPVRVDRDLPLVRIAEQVSQRIRELKKYQRFPYGELARAVNPDPAAPPLYDVAYSHMKLPDADHVHELISKTTVHNPGTATNAVTIVSGEDGRDGTLGIQLFYDERVFDANFPIEAAVRSIATMLTASLDRPETPVRALPLLSERARAEMAAFEAGPRIEFPDTTIDRLFTATATDHPNRVAVISADSGKSTYAELLGLVDGFAARLHELGATGNECVPVILPRSTEMLVAVLAVLRAGCAYVPLDPDAPTVRLEAAITDCGARFVVAGSDHAQLCADLGPTRVAVDDIRPGAFDSRARPDALSYLIYTSGSTGEPKGVMVEHRSVVNRLTWMQRRYPLAADDVILHKTPTTFDVSVWELFWWAISGASVAVLGGGGERDPRRIVAAIEANAVTVVHFVPSMLAAFVDELEADRTAVTRVASLRRVFSSGEALPPALVRRFYAAFTAVGEGGPRLVNLYGPTEATVDVSSFDCPLPDDPRFTRDDAAHDTVPIGRPIDNIDLLVLDESGRRLPIGVPGELNIAGVGLARGYRARPDLTSTAFVDDPTVLGGRRYRTGDLVRRRADGDLEFLGRLDDQVKIRGNRIALGEVRDAILACAGVRAAVVVAERAQGHGSQLVCYFVGDAVTGPEIAARLAIRLPRYMIPTRLARIERIPLTHHGKADHKALAELADPGATNSGGASIEPRTPVEAELARVVRTVLGIESIGVHDNFFTHGGDSILALSVRTAAERAGLYFDVDTFHTHPTIAELARIVSEGPSGDRPSVTDRLATVPLIDRAALQHAEDAFPATALQLGMLFHSIERAGSATYKDVFRYRLDMPWDADQFRAAFDRLVRRRPALRSSFAPSEYSIPLQIVHAAIDGELEIVDLAEFDPADAAREIEDYIRARRHADYDFGRGPLHAVRVFRHRSGPARASIDLVLSFHHAILDGWSVATSVFELLVDYLNKLGLLESDIDDTPQPTGVLAEYAQAEVLAAQNDSAREFWRTTLAGAETTALTGLEVHESARAARRPHSAAVLPRGLAERVTAFAAGHRLPEKAVYLAAHCLMLRTLTGRGDITTGVIGHGRPDRAGAENFAGLFLNTLPMRLDASATTWREAVEQVARLERDSYPYRRYPLRSILADGGPAIETAFNFVNYHLFTPILGSDRVTLREFDVREETNFQLLVTVVRDPRDGRMRVRVDGDRALTQEQCDAAAVTLLRMSAAIVADVDEPIDRATGPATARDVGALVADTAALRPHAVAIRGDESAITYDDLIERGERLTRRLGGAGIGPGDRIGILMRRRPETVLLVLALARIGATCVPLDVGYPRSRLNLMIDRARPRRVIADADFAEIVDDARLVLDTADLFAPADDAATESTVPEHLSPDAIAYVLFTSGSTGEPKGVAMSHRGLTALVDWQIRSRSGRDPATTLQLAPLSFDVAFQEIFTTLATGSTLRVSSADLRADVEELLNTVVDEGIERLFLPYVALQAFAEAAVARRRFPARLKVLVSSGEQLRITGEIRELCRRVPGLLLENQYGPTESHVATTFSLHGSPDGYPALPPIGRPVDGDTAELLDSALCPVADGVIGELYLGGRSLASGYHDRSGLTAQRFVAADGGDIRYRTGDLGVRLSSGDLVCLGRGDSQVKIRGFRVEPAEVELCVLGLVERYPAITEVAVVARRFGGVDGELVAFLVGASEQTDPAALRNDLREILPAHMVPARFVFVAELPRTPSGKRDDGALRSLAESVSDHGGGARREPADEYERSAVELLAEYAGRTSIGVDDDFFTSGGTSIGAMRAVMALSRRFDVDVPLDSFIGAPTAARLAALIRSGDIGSAFDPLVPIIPGGAEAPLFLVHPIGGNVLCYLPLARQLARGRAVYGLQAAGADAGSTPETTIVGMAESYLAAVRRVYPEGPYHLAGWSFGGFVALEMARRLPERDVASVTLLDTIALREQAREPVADRQLIRWFFFELLWYAEGNEVTNVEFDPDDHRSEELFDAMLAQAIRSAILPPNSSPRTLRRLYEVFHANYTAMLEYPLYPYDRDITLLRAEDGLPPGVDLAHRTVGSMFDSQDNGWQPYAARRFTLIPVPGDHLHMMTEPHVREVAARLDSILTSADRREDLDRNTTHR
nr:non-ribosomal peptide synthetase [Nocardia bovistercoris]